MYTVKRTQIYLDEEQTSRLDERATAGGTTRSGVIRAAIDSYLAPGGEDWRAHWNDALRATGGAAPYLPDDHLDVLRAAGADKLTQLERRTGA